MTADGLRPAVLYDYLLAARRKLLDFVRPLDVAQYTQEFPFAHKTIRATLVHIAAAEWLYNRRLRGESVPPSPDRPFTRFSETEFPPLEGAWRAQSEETQQTLREIADWARPVEWVAPLPPAAGAAVPVPKTIRFRTTTGGIAAQLVVHEVHHRAQVMAMLRHLGVVAEILDYSALMFERTDVTG